MRILTASIFLLIAKVLVAQPFINSVDPINASARATITLVGSGFSSTVLENQVYLGAGKATITSAGTNRLTVQVPPNATTGPIVYTNLSTGLSASFGQHFQYSFGTSSFDMANFATPVDNPTGELQTYDICACDVDGDGDNDIIVTNNEEPTSAADDSELLIYENTSTPTGGVSFSGPTRLGDDPTIKVTCLDLNADGFPEIVATEGANNNDEIFIYVNQQSGSVATSFSSTPNTSLLTPRDAANNIRNPEVVQSADMDGDGLLDLVIGNASDEVLDIYRNTSSGSGLTFESTPFQLQGPSGAGSFRGVALGDLNGDNTPELIITELSSENIYVYRNESLSGSLSFGGPTTITVASGELRNVIIADLNSDGLMDIAASDVQLNRPNGNVVLVQNTTSGVGGQPTFSDAQLLQSLPQPWGLSAGDLDGDGDLDLAVASEDEGANALNVIINNGTSGSTISAGDFTVNSISLGFNSRNIKITDINQDGKSDLIYTSNSRSGQEGRYAVILNNNCVTPNITPNTDFFCNGTTFEIEAIDTVASSYSWEVDSGSGFAVDVSRTGGSLDISGYSSDLQVRTTLTTADGLCTVVSPTASFTLRSISISTPTITSGTSLCSGADLILSTSATASNYYWTGPNGLDTVATSASISIANVEPVNTGTYQLQTEDGGSCKSLPATVTIQVLPVPVVSVINAGDDTFCEGGSATLQVRNISGVTYQWQSDGSDIDGATSTSLTADATANYQVVLTQDNCDRPSKSISINEVVPPAARLNALDEICIDVPLSLSSTSTGETGFTIDEQWEFFDSSGTSVGTASGTTVTFTYNTAGVSSALLTAEYNELTGCLDRDTARVIVSEIPNIAISTPDGNQKCPSDSLALELDAGELSYDWVDISSGSPDTLTRYTDQNIAYINTTDGRSTATVRATILTTIGCVASATVSIEDFANSGVSIVSDELEIIDGNITIPPMTNGVDLRASNGSNFLWEPRAIFTDSTGSQTRAFPSSATTEVILSATDVNGCAETDIVTLLNNNVLPRTGFSPNGDGLGYECWEILNSAVISGCTVHIFDSRGRNILVAEAPFENDCVWDGTSSGAESPIGVYYFVLECEDEQLSQSGSILLAR